MQSNPEKRDPDDDENRAVVVVDLDEKPVADFEQQFSQLSRWDTTGESIGGSGVAGAIYAVLAGLFLAFYSSSLIYMAVLWPLFMIFGFFVAAFSAFLVTAIVIPMNASIGWPLSPRWSGFVIGGLAGFLPFIFLLSIDRPPQGNDLLTFNAWGPFPAMTLGHFWAFFMTDYVIIQHNRRSTTINFQKPTGTKTANRFRITHLMILTAWIAVGFAIISSLPSELRNIILQSYLQTQPASAALALALILISSSLRSKMKNAARVTR